ncbi:hypothetical protein PV327_001627 [Microctonus hyperodae]|uniref:Pre-mRNA splicing factor component Cdc5p/Cef1 C-terminal domain-containing protein n=1 Tax=Microctonus hyperodae TaxID=165561 RepID=A0AA39FDW8_MICHY|nr:hypothetical protein PV327_001627 [Microctonus hyperodae]
MQSHTLPNPILPNNKRGVTVLSQAQSYLEQNPYQNIEKDVIDIAKQLLMDEMEVVRDDMAHGELSLDAYSAVWEKCSPQILYLENQSKDIRATKATKKGRIVASKIKLNESRVHMTVEAKRAARWKRKLNILLGRYQTRAQVSTKQLHDLREKIEQAQLQLSAFQFLEKQEQAVAQRRINQLIDDVKEQNERERSLQLEFAKFKEQLQQIQ